MRHQILFASIMALAMAASATAQQAVFEEPYWTKSPVIEALGRADVELPPNRASFSVSFVETDRDAEDAMKAAVSRARIAYDAIKAVAGDNSRVTTSVMVDAYYDQYRDSDGNMVENIRPDKVKGYEGTASVSVTVTEISLAGEARAAALALSPEISGTMRVYLERTAEVNRTAYEAAVADAAARAKASAMAAGASLGRLLVIQEGNGPCLGHWTSQPGRVRGGYMAAPPPSPQYAGQNKVVVQGTRRGTRGQEEAVIITQDDLDALNLPSDREPQTVQAQVCIVYAVKP